MWRGVCVFGAIVTVCVLGAGQATAATAAEEPPLSFVSPDTLRVTCAELAAGEGVAIVVRNETGAEQDATLAIELNDESGAEANDADVCGGLTFNPPGLKLEGGKRGTVKLEGDAAREGNFSGSLVLSPKSGRVTKRSISISSEPVTPAAVPLVESQSANHNHLDPTDQGPIWVPVNLPMKDVPRLRGDQKAATLGALSGSNGAVAVTYSGDRKPLTATTSLIGLNVSDSGPGSYSGSVDLLPDDEAGKVTIDLTMTTWWLLPALVLSVGIATGVWLIRQTGLTQPEAQLLTRIEALEARHRAARRRLLEAAEPKGEADTWGAFDISDVGELQEELRQRVSASTKGQVVKLDEDVLKDLKTRITAVETQIDLLTEIPKHADDLETALAKRLHEEPDPALLPPLPPGHDGIPLLVVRSEAALRGAAVPAGKLKPLVEAIDTRTGQIDTLRGLEARLSELWIEKQWLEPSLGKPQLDQLVKALNWTRRLLLKAVGGEELTAAAAKIQAALVLSIDLGLEPKSEVAAAVLDLNVARATAMDSTQIEIKTEGDTDVVVVPSQSAPSPQPAKAAAPLRPTPKPQLSRKETERKLESARWSQAIVIVLVALATFSLGMGTLYVGKAWGGSGWDWIAIFAWGIVGQALVATLATSINEAGALRRVVGR